MSNFTTKPPKCPTLVTLEESHEGQVDIMVKSRDGYTYRIAAIGDRTLHLFSLSEVSAKQIGLQIDNNGFPVVVRGIG